MADNFKIMVVDDSSTVRKTAELILSKEGFEVISEVDGFSALSGLEEARPNLIFMDVMMPNLDGYDTCQIIKGSPSDISKTPVIMLTSKDGAFDKARGQLAGCDAFITKPFTRDDLIKVIEKYK
ncbi:response regulator [Wohlfahrtiimonas chitiniclastica]|uniref:Protein pilG n=2 Tax=Wohlfahrtiimonas chitiniclastica TaxID=400946 RepID=L8Y244_9GAMM|nr:response regulator [Wohlfahrtiimonas chitiniclastica]ELV09000.1 Protein pilG [Wohlfahrtiimonas chitiniclastica SH04]KZS24052.1 two-component system response regulator [Wohlfahrtiimonas chitiniclastica]KZX37660.1 two-component system response regulator [Wohlfahrtiimonas chitiniclastica]MBS7814589.1 response regulator [Wohlfahrtiimonas chitiniclastica]MBS7817261.1 response regulator [Wohlfahrtiimonas chitiniclastica]